LLERKEDAMHLTIDRVASPIGTMLLACDGDGRLRALDFADYEPRMQILLARHYGSAGFTLATGTAPGPIRGGLRAFFDGDLDALTAISVQTGGTEFQRRVWSALREIPAGTTTTYGSLASALGRAGASRAVGLANGSNPIAIVVPCHRVIGADGGLTGYGGGMERKRWLLSHEQKWSRLPLWRSASGGE
jgi:methylated-DNA-[protein]-cysteine S-methyltransferase